VDEISSDEESEEEIESAEIVTADLASLSSSEDEPEVAPPSIKADQKAERLSSKYESDRLI